MFSYIHPSGPEAAVKDEFIHKYFTKGSASEIILDLLATKHNISVSVSTFKRRLQNADLTERMNYAPVAAVQAVFSEELQGSGSF